MSSNDQSEVWIATSADEAYLDGAAVALRSAVEKVGSGTQVHVRVLDSGLNPTSADRLEEAILRWPRVASAEVLQPDIESIADLPIAAHFSVASYARLQAQDMIDVDTLVYIDSDALVLDDVSRLASLDLGDDLAAAVVDAHLPTLAEGLPDQRDRLGGRGDHPYFNCGILIMRPRKWQETDVAGKVTRYSRDNAETLQFVEQDGLNFVLAGRIREIAPRWNVQLGAVLAVREPANRPAAHEQPAPSRSGIVHYVGRKPWGKGIEPYPDLIALNVRWILCLSRTGLYSRSEMVRWSARWLAGQASHFTMGARNKLCGTLGRKRARH